MPAGCIPIAYMRFRWRRLLWNRRKSKSMVEKQHSSRVFHQKERQKLHQRHRAVSLNSFSSDGDENQDQDVFDLDNNRFTLDERFTIM